MDPLVKAHLRIAALEQQLQDPTRIRAQMGSSFSAHYLRVVPLPGDIILCAEMDEPMPVLMLDYHSDKTAGEFGGFVVSGVWSGGFQHTCRPNTCMGTIKILRRSRGKFENELLRTEYGKGPY